MWNLLGGALGAIGSIYGANVQQEDTQATNAANMMMNQQNIASQQQMNAANLAQQLNFAQNSAGWNLTSDVNAAKAAGINPLSALGVGGTSFSNLVAPQASIPMVPNKDAALAYSQAGQSLGRAISAIQSPEDKAFDIASKQLQLQKDQAAIDYTHAQTQAVMGHGGIGAAGNPPGVPTFSEPGVKAGVTPDAQLTQTASGDLTVTPPKDIAALGFFHPASLSWYARNGLMPAFDSDYAPESQRSKSFNPFTMTYTDKPWWKSDFVQGTSGYNYSQVGSVPGNYW